MRRGLAALAAVSLSAAAGMPPFLVADLDGGKGSGAVSLNADENGLGTQVQPAPFETAKEGAPPSPRASAHLWGHLGRDQQPYSWVQLRFALSAGQPMDLSAYKSLSFWTKGDGETHKVRLLKESVTDHDHFVYRFPTGPEWRQVKLPLDALRQAGWGKAQPAVFDDVHAVEFSPGVEDSDFDLWVDHVEFSQDEAAIEPKAYDTAGWWTYPGVDVEARRGTALDASGLLDAPAGKHGWLKPLGEDFVFARTGKAQRFFGLNLVAGANFPDHAEAERVAELLAQCGSNITRHHHLEAAWTSRNVFGKKGSTLSLDPVEMERFDYLVAQLQKRGIYQYFDLLVSRQALAADGAPEAERLSNGWKVKAEYDPKLIELQEAFVRQFLGHKNPYTGKVYGRDPAVAMMEIINEDSLFYRQREGEFSAQPGHYLSGLTRQYNAWLLKAHKTRAALQAAWAPSKAGEEGLAQGEDPAAGSVALMPDPSRARESAFSAARKRDEWRFYYELQLAYYRRMAKLVRSLGFQGPIAGSNHWTLAPADLLANAQLDFIDRHAYWSHPQGGWGYDTDVTFDPRAMVRSPSGGIIGELANRRVAGKPFIVTEYQSSAPNDYRADGLLLMGAYACLQNWSAIQFAFSHDQGMDPQFKWPLDSNFNVANQPAMLALWPAVARLALRGDVAAASEEAWQRMSSQEALDPGAALAPPGPAALARKVGLMFEAALAGGDTGPGAFEDGAGGWVGPPDGGLKHDARKGLLLVDTPRTQGFAGFTHGEAQSLAGMEAEVENRYAVLLATSLDGEALGKCRRVLITAVANAVNEGMSLEPSGSRLRDVGGPAVLVEPVRGLLKLAVPGPAKAFALDPSGRRTRKVAAIAAAGRLEIPLAPGQQAMHYEVTVEGAAP